MVNVGKYTIHGSFGLQHAMYILDNTSTYQVLMDELYLVMSELNQGMPMLTIKLTRKYAQIVRGGREALDRNRISCISKGVRCIQASVAFLRNFEDDSR